MTRVWLASGSPRRSALLQWCGLAVDVHPADVDETRRAHDDPVSHARRLAAAKGATAAPDRVFVAADTVVHQDDQVFDKPVDRQEARRHLVQLSGGWHQVTTGVCVGKAAHSTVFAVTTAVRFRCLTPAEIDAYLATGEADDKAGAYGIQGRAGAFVGEITGSWTNVVGLPVEETLRALATYGVERTDGGS